MSKDIAIGCSFLLHSVGDAPIFIADNFNEEQEMFAETAERFMEKEIQTHSAEIENKKEGLVASLIKKAGEVGLLMIDIPEAYGGLGLSKTTSMLCTEKLGTHPSFSVSLGAHVGIGSLPLVFFGTHEQKLKYLPRLASGELLAAYALTEPGSGSDALGAKTRAQYVKGADGKGYYKLNGTKAWITNAGFADLFTVFAKVDGKKFTAFLIEASSKGLSTGNEEHKMGIRGSSTRLLILEDVMVPEENVLGQVGRGHKIAFNILNVGRFKLGVAVLGTAKRTLGVASTYAQERKQFGVQIASFGAIQEKLAQMATDIYTLESMSYRVAGDMDDAIYKLDSNDPNHGQDVMKVIEAFAIEDSIMKVFGSETVSFVADEALQIHGGYGYSEEYEVERIYRDARIQRIFEGTNEVNRLLIPGTLLKRAMKGELNLFGLIGKVDKIAKADKAVCPAWNPKGLEQEMFLTEKAKQLTMFISNQAIQKHMADIKDQQEILMAMADMLIACYGMDSTVSRVLQLEKDGKVRTEQYAVAHLCVAKAYAKVVDIAYQLIPTFAQGDRLERRFKAMDKFTFHCSTDRVAQQKIVAEKVLDREKWSF